MLKTLTLSIVLVSFVSGAVLAGDRSSYGRKQARRDAAVGYRVAVIKGDERCRPPRDYNAAGYARPIDVLGTPNEPTGYEAEHMKQWSCSYQRPDGTIVNYGSSFTPLEQWRHSRAGGDGGVQ